MAEHTAVPFLTNGQWPVSPVIGPGVACDQESWSVDSQCSLLGPQALWAVSMALASLGLTIGQQLHWRVQPSTSRALMRGNKHFCEAPDGGSCVRCRGVCGGRLDQRPEWTWEETARCGGPSVVSM